MYRRLILVVPIFLLCGIMNTQACCHNFPGAFLSTDKMAGETMLAYEVKLLGKAFFPALEKANWQSSTLGTIDADLKDFTQFIQSQHASKNSEKMWISQYKSFAEKSRKGEMASLPITIPGVEEFVLYLNGVRELKQSKKTEIPASWLNLMELPAASRKYRTTWVLYMMGNMSQGAQKEKLYNQLRQASGGDFHDTLGLAHISFKTALGTHQDKVYELRAAVKGYMYYQSVKDKDNTYICLNQLRTLLKNNRYNPAVYRKWANDKICRELMLSYLSSYTIHWRNHYNEKLKKRIPFDIFTTLKGKTLKSAGHLAWIAYECGRYEEAAAFTHMAAEKGLIALWINARLARRKGNTADAVKYLKKWLKVYKEKATEEGNRLFFIAPYTECYHNFQAQVSGELGKIRVTQNDCLEALHCFMKAKSWADAAGVAEQLLDVKTLKSYVDTYCQMATKRTRTPHENLRNDVKYFRNSFTEVELKEVLRHLLARRLFQQGRLKTALTYMPPQFQPATKAYIKQMAAAKDQSNTPDQRALAYYNAAKILRWQGMELSGTSLAPDYFIVGGNFNNCGQDRNWYLQFKNSRLENQALRNRVAPFKRFHYRYLASSLMWKAIQLAKSKELIAMAAYCGGRFIEARAPKEADKFYKKLVTVEAGPLSTVADKTRWFPNNFTLEEELRNDTPTTLEKLKKLLKKEAKIPIDESAH